MPESRSASLRVAHARRCPQSTKTSLSSLHGCQCQPSYYCQYRGADGRPVKTPRVKNRKVAEAKLRSIQVSIDEGRVGVGRRKTPTFNEWADGHAGRLEAHGRRASTRRAYVATLNYGRAAFGPMLLSDIGGDELRRFVAKCREGKCSDASISKHLRQLAAVLELAVPDKLDVNPVPRFRKQLGKGLHVPSGTPPYSNDELRRLWQAMRKAKVPNVYITAAQFMSLSGLRLGEMIGLDVLDASVSDRILKVRRSWDPLVGEVLPKNGKVRVLNLIPPAVTLLEGWIAATGVRTEGPLFPSPRTGGRLDARRVHRVLADALDAAEIAKQDEDGRPRKPAHSLRSSYARVLREGGVDPTWIAAQLGHASVSLLDRNVYGRWSSEAMQSTADNVDPRAFQV
jgi:integrase